MSVVSEPVSASRAAGLVEDLRALLPTSARVVCVQDAAEPDPVVVVWIPPADGPALVAGLQVAGLAVERENRRSGWLRDGFGGLRVDLLLEDDAGEVSRAWAWALVTAHATAAGRGPLLAADPGGASAHVAALAGRVGPADVPGDPDALALLAPTVGQLVVDLLLGGPFAAPLPGGEAAVDTLAVLLDDAGAGRLVPVLLDPSSAARQVLARHGHLVAAARLLARG